jgi:hypothetical protein
MHIQPIFVHVRRINIILMTSETLPLCFISEAIKNTCSSSVYEMRLYDTPKYSSFDKKGKKCGR